MKPKGGDGMNEKMEQIRRAVKAGKLTADGARKALEDEMERELSQKPEDIDMDVVNACEALLTELSDADEALEEFIHLLAAQCHTDADRHFLTELEVRDILARESSDCFLTGDGGHLCNSGVDQLLVLSSFADALVDDNLLQARHAHHG